MSGFNIKPATRSGVIPLIGAFGPSGTGKTMSALLLMRGLVGPEGRITLIDSEAGRGSLFADVIPGGYSVLDLDAPFSPDRYFEAFDVAEKSSDGIVIDSLTHAHNGEGGMLDIQEAELTRMAGENNYSKREACKLASWIPAKMQIKRFIGRILRSKVPLICCLRAEPKTHMVKDDSGKNKVITDQFSTPIFDSKFIYELLLNFETYSKNGQGGYVIPRKITHPSLAALVPKENEQIGVKHGIALAEWCAGGSTAPVVKESLTTPKTDPKTAELKRKLWSMTKVYHMESIDKLNQWLIDEQFISDDQRVADLTADQLSVTIGRVEEWMAKGHGA